VPCSECERRAFYRIELLGEKHLPCGGAHACTPTPVLPGDPTWASRKWFYELHDAIRELLDQNGDVPLLAGQALAATARSFEDIAELDFCRLSQKPAEIDIIAFADGRLIIGEAKCVPAFGSNKEASQAIAKLIDISDLLGTDEILLATTAPGPWHERDTGLLLNEVARHTWRFGKAPLVRVLANLRDDPWDELPENSYTP
jgi:hypothetical protein